MTPAAQAGSGRRLRHQTRLRALAAAVVAMAAAPAFAAAVAPPSLVLDDVVVVDVRSGALARGREILIEDGRITRIVRAHSLKPVAGVRVVDGRGRYVVPGFLDMHAHVLNSPTPQAALSLMLAYGITGYRQMSGSPQLLQARRDGRLPIPEASPALLATSGTILAGGPAVPAAAMVAEVDRQKAQGADFIKIIDLGAPAYFAALDEATRQGLPFDGHLPRSVDPREAARRGLRGIEHLGPNESLLLGCSSQEAAIRADIARAPVPPARLPSAVPPQVLRRVLAEPLLFESPLDLALISRTIDTYDEGRCRDLARTLAARGVWQTPTLARLKAMEFSNDPAYARDPDLKYVSADDRRMWTEIAHDFAVLPPPERNPVLARLWPLQLRLVKLFDEAGVPMMAGTDEGAQWLVPGASLHQEFDLLAQAGVPPLHVLRMATLNGAVFLGRGAAMGAVEPGKAADLVLLDADPTRAVAAMHTVRAVVRAGAFYDRDDLEALKRRAEQVEVKGAPAP